MCVQLGDDAFFDPYNPFGTPGNTGAASNVYAPGTSPNINPFQQYTYGAQPYGGQQFGAQQPFSPLENQVNNLCISATTIELSHN